MINIELVEEEETGPDLSTIELDLENLAMEFPDECLIYMSNKMEIGLDDEKREKEYECFRVSSPHLTVISILVTDVRDQMCW